MDKIIPTSQDIICNAERYNQSDSYTCTGLLCGGYKLAGSFTLKEIADFIRARRDEHAGHILLATLDDIWQAAYTCGHSTFEHELDNTEGHDLSNLPPEVFEEFDGNLEHQGYLTLIDEFPIRYKNFMTKAVKEHQSNLKGQLWWFEESFGNSVMINSDLPSIPREETSYVQIVPVASAPEALAAYPNGYFSCDLNPFQNYALSKYLLDNFGFHLFGVGASYLGFMRDDSVDTKTAEQLGQYLSDLYDGYSGDIPLKNVLISKVLGQREFYLAYVER